MPAEDTRVAAPQLLARSQAHATDCLPLPTLLALPHVQERIVFRLKANRSAYFATTPTLRVSLSSDAVRDEHIHFVGMLGFDLFYYTLQSL